VLGLPPAFNLSHDQTLQLKVFASDMPGISSAKLFDPRGPDRLYNDQTAIMDTHPEEQASQAITEIYCV
jgi:hypothetical protein